MRRYNAENSSVIRLVGFPLNCTMMTDKRHKLCNDSHIIFYSLQNTSRFLFIGYTDSDKYIW